MMRPDTRVKKLFLYSKRVALFLKKFHKKYLKKLGLAL